MHFFSNRHCLLGCSASKVKRYLAAVNVSVAQTSIMTQGDDYKRGYEKGAFILEICTTCQLVLQYYGISDERFVHRGRLVCLCAFQRFFCAKKREGGSFDRDRVMN